MDKDNLKKVVLAVIFYLVFSMVLLVVAFIYEPILSLIAVFSFYILYSKN